MPFHGTALSYDSAYEIIGGLSDTSKMPWFSWSISAYRCKTGGKLREVENSTCSHCYACKGFYPIPKVQAALERRYEALSDPRFVEAFAIVLNTLRAETTEDRFRWHDSGDLQNLDHLKKIVSICAEGPTIRHYLPTREAGIVKSFLKGGGKFPPNLFLKLSAPMVGQTYKKQPQGLAFSTVGVDDDPKLFQCPAKKYHGNRCLKCDKCWTTANINYPLH